MSVLGASWRSCLAFLVDPVQTFKLLKSPDDRVNTTLVQIRITDHIGPPYTVFNIGYFEVRMIIMLRH